MNTLIIRKNRTKRKGVTLVIVLVSLSILLLAAGLVIDTGIVLNAQNELQKQTETAALFGATLFEPKRDGSNVVIRTSDIKTSIQEIFELAQSMNFYSELNNDDIEINPVSKAVRLTSTSKVKTYFLHIANIYVISIKAQATAISSPFYLSENFPITPYTGSLMSTSSTEINIRQPIGFNQNAGTDNDEVLFDDYLYGEPDNKSIPLGSGGYITIRLPVPVVDEEGADLYIKELGNMEGYFVYAGNNADPEHPYINEGDQGYGINWTNISCTGIPEVDTSTCPDVGAYQVDVDYLTGTSLNEVKFYGSGYFDLGLTCSDGNYNSDMKSANYIKIIDDNAEDGFMASNPSVPVGLFGEHSSATPGADIDAVGILHHSRLIMSSDFGLDSDSDGLIDVIEEIIGTNTGNNDTDNDGMNDGLEYSGWYDNASSPTSIIDNSSGGTGPSAPYVNITSPVVNESTLANPLIFD